jgi:hypothetical protein
MSARLMHRLHPPSSMNPNETGHTHATIGLMDHLRLIVVYLNMMLRVTDSISIK